MHVPQLMDVCHARSYVTRQAIPHVPRQWFAGADHTIVQTGLQRASHQLLHEKRCSAWKGAGTEETHDVRVARHAHKLYLSLKLFRHLRVHVPVTECATPGQEGEFKGLTQEVPLSTGI